MVREADQEEVAVQAGLLDAAMVEDREGLAPGPQALARRAAGGFARLSANDLVSARVPSNTRGERGEPRSPPVPVARRRSRARIQMRTRDVGEAGSGPGGRAGAPAPRTGSKTLTVFHHRCVREPGLKDPATSSWSASRTIRRDASTSTSMGSRSSPPTASRGPRSRRRPWQPLDEVHRRHPSRGRPPRASRAGFSDRRDRWVPARQLPCTPTATRSSASASRATRSSHSLRWDRPSVTPLLGSSLWGG